MQHRKEVDSSSDLVCRLLHLLPRLMSQDFFLELLRGAAWQLLSPVFRVLNRRSLPCYSPATEAAATTTTATAPEAPAPHRLLLVLLRLRRRLLFDCRLLHSQRRLHSSVDSSRLRPVCHHHHRYSNTSSADSTNSSSSSSNSSSNSRTRGSHAPHPHPKRTTTGKASHLTECLLSTLETCPVLYMFSPYGDRTVLPTCFLLVCNPQFLPAVTSPLPPPPPPPLAPLPPQLWPTC